MHKAVYILLVSNGLDYEDYADGIGAVSSSLKGALAHYKKGDYDRSVGSEFLAIQKWKNAKQIAAYNQNGKKTWPLSASTK